MSEYPDEPFPLRLTRSMTAILPKGRSALCRRVAAWCGCPTQFNATVDGITYPIHLDERVSRTLYLYGSFEPVISSLMSSMVKPGDIVFDVGANFGYFTMLLSRLAREGRVIAFEPDPRNIERLLQTLRSNRVENVQVETCALYDRVGTITFHLSTDNEDNFGSSSVVQDDSKRANVEVASETIDHFVATGSIDHIDFMKMDIEGGEGGALAGASETLAGQVIRVLLLELHVAVMGVDESRKQIDRLLAHGYRARFIDETRTHNGDVRLLPIEKLDLAAASNPHLLFEATRPVAGVRS